jgi:hypothetical protein
MDEFFAEEEEMFADYGAEEPRFEPDAKAFERVGPSGKLAELLSSPTVLEDMGKKGRESISPEDRFLINTDAMCRRLNSENIAKISELDITNMLEKTVDVVGLRYKNHVGYILGYLASQGGKSLKTEQVKYVIKNILPQVAEEGGIAPPDVVRYARFWKEFL